MRIIKRTEIDRPKVTYNLEIANDHNYLTRAGIAANCHSAKGDVLFDLLTGPLARVPLRWGMSGTIPKEPYVFNQILAGIGPIVGSVRAADLQEKGVLSNCHVHVEQLDDNHSPFPDYPSERQWLCNDSKRLNWIANRIREISKTGNTLILVNNIETGKFLQNLVPDSVFVSGAMKTKDRRTEYKEVQTASEKTIIATFGVAAVGINIPRIFNLVIFEAGSSDIRVIQSIGRALRTAADKDFANVYDICSTLKFSKRHLAKRKKMYDEAEYKYTVTKIKY